MMTLQNWRKAFRERFLKREELDTGLGEHWYLGEEVEAVDIIQFIDELNALRATEFYRKLQVLRTFLIHGEVDQVNSCLNRWINELEKK